MAHLGFLRRMLRLDVEGSGVAAADVGLVAVDPNYQRQGIGAQLLAQARQAMSDLGIGFGFLTCRPEVVPFYQGGWHLVPELVTRMIDNDGLVEDSIGPALFLPVAATASDWPEVPMVVRDGYEV